MNKQDKAEFLRVLQDATPEWLIHNLCQTVTSIVEANLGSSGWRNCKQIEEEIDFVERCTEQVEFFKTEIVQRMKLKKAR